MHVWRGKVGPLSLYNTCNSPGRGPPRTTATGEFMPPSATVTEPGWCGWYRAGRRERWRKLAEAPTYDAAWGLLLDRLPREGKGGESVVLPVGRDANETASAPRRKPR